MELLAPRAICCLLALTRQELYAQMSIGAAPPAPGGELGAAPSSCWGIPSLRSRRALPAGTPLPLPAPPRDGLHAPKTLGDPAIAAARRPRALRSRSITRGRRSRRPGDAEARAFFPKFLGLASGAGPEAGRTTAPGMLLSSAACGAEARRDAGSLRSGSDRPFPTAPGACWCSLACS